MKLKFALILFLTAPVATKGEDLFSCGASEGWSIFFDKLEPDPDGSHWERDAISGGVIVLTKSDDKFDIVYSDAIGARSYTDDGASVFLLSSSARFTNIIAVSPNYTDQYTFDAQLNEVVWTSHKTGTVFPKVGIYRAKCLTRQ